MKQLTELEMLLEMLQLDEESEKKSQDQTEAKNEMVEKERKQATEMREREQSQLFLTLDYHINRFEHSLIRHRQNTFFQLHLSVLSSAL